MSTLIWFILTFIFSYFIYYRFNKLKNPVSEMWQYSKYSRRNFDYQPNTAFAELEEAEYEIIE